MHSQNRPISHHVLFLLVAGGIVALGARLYAFQRDGQVEMSARAELQQRMRLPIPARRGSIYASGYKITVLMAASREVPYCFADPLFIDDDEIEPVARSLSGVVGVPAEQIRQSLLRRRDRRWVRLASDLTDAQAKAVKDLKLPGVGILMEPKRSYPNGQLAAHVIGYCGRDGREGLEGMELFAENYLRATDGQRVVLTDAARRPIWNSPGEYEPPSDGGHVFLTIDVVIQGFLEEAISEIMVENRPESVVGVVMDPRTGDVLAMANEPTFDPNAFWLAPTDARRNRAITDSYEPGSIFKPYTAVMALYFGVTHMGDMFNCHGGAYRCKSGRLLRDATGYGIKPFEFGVYKSVNTLMAQLGELLGNEKLYQIVRHFGFGAKTGIELCGEDPGLVRPFDQWDTYSTTSIPMGHEVGITVLQIATAFSSLANDGVLMRPRLIRMVTSADGTVLVDNTEPTPVRRVVPSDLNRMFVEEVLAKVPTIGTGKRGKLSGWTSIGKTGTAQISPYSARLFTASYISAAPVRDSRLVCIISVRKPDDARGGHYGGTVAAPRVKQVMEKSLAYLGVPKDQ